MGLFDFIIKAAEFVEALTNDEHCSSSDIERENTADIIAECEHYLSLVVKLTVEDEEDIINTFTAFDRRYLKLDRIDSSTDDFALSKELNELSTKRERAMNSVQSMYYDLLDELSEKSSAESDPEEWSRLNNQWFEYDKKLSRITDYDLKYMERLGNQALDILM